MELSSIITQIVAGISRGAIFFLLASGLTLVFGIIKVINFAHGSLYLLSMYIFYSLTVTVLSKSLLGFWFNIILAPIIVMILGVVLEIVFLRKLYKEEHLLQLLFTFALVYIISDSIKLIWGVLPKSVSRPQFLSGSISISGGIIPTYNLLVICFAVGIGLGLWAILNKTRFGKIARASASDPETTNSLGVDVNNVFTGIFAIGTFLAALSGALNLPLTSARLGLDAEMIILAFVIVIIGGVGSISGAAFAALVVGFVEAFGIMYVPRFTIVLIYIIMVVMLMTRPFGLFGRAVR